MGEPAEHLPAEAPVLKQEATPTGRRDPSTKNNGNHPSLAGRCGRAQSGMYEAPRLVTTI